MKSGSEIAATLDSVCRFVLEASYHGDGGARKFLPVICQDLVNLFDQPDKSLDRILENLDEELQRREESNMDYGMMEVSPEYILRQVAWVLRDFMGLNEEEVQHLYQLILLRFEIYRLKNYEIVDERNQFYWVRLFEIRGFDPVPGEGKSLFRKDMEGVIQKLSILVQNLNRNRLDLDTKIVSFLGEFQSRKSA